MKKAIIFGVTGQDGSYLAEHLLGLDYEVCGVIRRTSGASIERLENVYLNKKFSFVQGDITDPTSLSRIIKEIQADEIYNLAAQSHVGVSFDEPLHTFDVTAKGCLNILEAIRNESPKSRFYQASSSEMFGAKVDPDGFQRETSPFLPQSPYAVAKVTAHYATRMYRVAYKLHASSGILFNHESERRGDTFLTRKVTKYIAQLVCGRTNEKLKLGNLEAYRDWGHAMDYVRAMHLMLQQDNPDDYVIATGESHSVREFVQKAFSYAGMEKYENFIEQDARFMRAAEVAHLKGDASKAKWKLSWEPRVSFDLLIQRMVDNDIRLVQNDRRKGLDKSRIQGVEESCSQEG